MKKSTNQFLLMLIITLVFQAIVLSSWAQIPEKMSYQAVIRNSSNQLVVNQLVGMRISILQGSESGTAIYTETQKPTTNANGLVTIEIGTGTTSDNFSTIDWGNDPYYIKTETDPSGGTSYSISGVSQLLSVPFALYAKNVENDKVDDADNDPANEIQTISKTGSTVTLSKGGGSVSVDDADADPTNEIQALSKSGNMVILSKGGGSVSVDDADDDPANEIQTISLSDNNLTLSKSGGTVILPAGADNWGAQTAVTNATLEGNGAPATPLKIAQQAATNGQVLKWNGTTWTPGNDDAGESGLTLPYSQTIANGDYAFSVTNTFGSAIEGIATSTSNLTYGVYGGSSSSVNGASGLYGENTALTGLTQGVYGESYSISGSGVWGHNRAETGYTKGVFGTSSSSQGYGIYGYNNASTGTTYGVYGGTLSPTGYGVYGEAFRFGVYGKASVYGIVGEADAEYGMGVCGRSTSSSGMNYGVIGESFSTSGFGVYGHSAASSGVTFGLYGISESPDGYGVFGYASKYGLYGSSSHNGIYGEASSGDGNGVYGLATSTSGLTHGVWGESASTSGVGVYGYSSALSGFTYGVIGLANSPDGGGIFGNGQRFGVFGQSSLYGIYGEANSQNGRGVFGIATSRSGNNCGVRGESSSSSGNGVYGMTSASSGSTIGVYGESLSPDGYGVYGSAPRYGVYGYCASVDGFAGYFLGRLAVTDKVGIGTTSPNQAISVYRSTGNSAINFLNSNTGSTSSDGLFIGISGNSNYLWGYESYPLVLATNSTSRLYITSDGDIGIGSTAPSAKLHILTNSSTGYPHILLSESSNSFARLMFKNSYTNNWTIAGGPYSTSAGARLNFYYSATGDILVITGDGKVGIGTSSPTQALHVVGNAYKTVGGTSWATSSDIRLKNLLGNYTKGLKEITALQPVRYVYKENNPRKLSSTDEQVGFVAQDVQKVFPEAVTEAEDGYLDFNMHAINVALVNAIKELKAENDVLNERLVKLEKIMEANDVK
jgi:hypothetical protein